MMQSIKKKEIGLAIFTFLFSLLGNVAFYFLLLSKPHFILLPKRLECEGIFIFIGLFTFLAIFVFLPFFTFISGFLYCLVNKQDISPKFSENVSKYFIMLCLGVVLILLLYSGRGFNIENFNMAVLTYIMFVLMCVFGILTIWYFGIYLTLIYSGRFYNFLKKLVVKK